MTLDFSPVQDDTSRMGGFSLQFTREDLTRLTHESIDFFLDIVLQADDAAVTFAPNDPKADDPDAAEGEQHIGWGIGHLIVHTTASAEESATISALLARGIAYGREPRLRYETPWQTVTTQAQCIQRLEESRRMRIASLESWPDQPHLDNLRTVSERSLAHYGQQNAQACFVMGLYHDSAHYDQIRDALAQAQAAHTAQG